MKSLLQYRKTALFICVVFCGLFLAHLIGTYIYSGGKYIGLPGGSVSVGVVSENKPDPMNPLLYGNGKIDDTLYNLLFRGLIQYNSEKEIYEGDLANCDISNLKKITCILRDDAIWSDGTTITNEDIIASINVFKEKASLQSIKNALSSVNVKTEENAVIIESSGNNPLIVDALAYPIIRTDVIDQIKNNRLKKESYITSGPFIYEDSTNDTEYNYHTIILAKNPNYKKTVWLDKFRFRIFPDFASLQKGINTVEIIIPPLSQENIPPTTGLKEIAYRNYEFYGNFLNIEKLDPNLRAIIIRHLSLKFEESGPEIKNHIAVNSLFHKGGIIKGKTELPMTLQDFMSDKGYKRKTILLDELYNQTTTVSQGGKIPKMKYFGNGGGNAILYSDDPKAEISLFGKIPKTTTSVKVNDYTLREYQSGSPQFVYKISSAFGTLKNGKNTYHLQLAQKDGSILTETLTIYHTLDREEMAKYQSEVEQSLIAELNTPEKIAEREAKKQEKIKHIESLDGSYYYNDDGKPFSLQLAYVSDKEASTTYAEFIGEGLQELGIQTEIIPIETKNLDSLIKSGKKEYDMMIVGVRSPGMIADLGTAFFSSERGNPNFANVNNKQLVQLFGELKNTPDPDRAFELKNKIIDIMNEENFYLPISQPIHKFYMHLDVKGMHMPEIIPNYSALSRSFAVLSKREEYEKNLEGKNISGFFSWFGQQISPDNQ